MILWNYITESSLWKGSRGCPGRPRSPLGSRASPGFPSWSLGLSWGVPEALGRIRAASVFGALEQSQCSAWMSQELWGELWSPLRVALACIEIIENIDILSISSDGGILWCSWPPWTAPCWMPAHDSGTPRGSHVVSEAPWDHTWSLGTRPRLLGPDPRPTRCTGSEALVFKIQEQS